MLLFSFDFLMKFTYAPYNLCMHLDPFSGPKCFFFGQIDKNGPRNVIHNEHIFRVTFCPLFGPISDPLGHGLRPKMGRKNVHEPTLGSLGRILASTWRAPSGTMAS